MAKTSKTHRSPGPEKALRDAFRTMEAEPAPAGLKDHLDRLTGQPPGYAKRN